MVPLVGTVEEFLQQKKVIESISLSEILRSAKTELKTLNEEYNQLLKEGADQDKIDSKKSLIETRIEKLSEDLPKDNHEAIKTIKKEIVYSIEITIKLFEQSTKMFKRPSKQGFMLLEKLETLNDFLDEKITKAILEISHRKLTQKDAKKSVLLVQISNAIEQLGDLGEDLNDVSRDMFEKGLSMSYETIEAVDKIFCELRKNLDDIKSTFPEMSEKAKAEIKKREDNILALISRKYEEHLSRLNEERDYKGSNFVESVSIMETSVSKQREIRKYIEKYKELNKK